MPPDLAGSEPGAIIALPSRGRAAPRRRSRHDRRPRRRRRPVTGRPKQLRLAVSRLAELPATDLTTSS